MYFLFRKILQTSLLLVLASVLLHGCARHSPRHQPKEPAAPEQERTLRPEPEEQQETVKPTLPEQEEAALPDLKPQSGPAQTLYRDAEQAMQKGEYKRAEMLLERALRVEPGNGWYWHAMGRVQYEQGAYEQAIQFCLKSNSLARQDSDLKRNNRLLLKKARGKKSAANHK